MVVLGLLVNTMPGYLRPASAEAVRDACTLMMPSGSAVTDTECRANQGVPCKTPEQPQPAMPGSRSISPLHMSATRIPARATMVTIAIITISVVRSDLDLDSSWLRI
jgi:hypothetical protein